MKPYNPPTEQLGILTSKTASLHAVSRPLSFETEAREIKAWAQLLGDTLNAHPSGVGLAAPQVGWNIRMVAIEVSGRASPVQVWVNPIITRKVGSRISREGCLSLPGQYFDCQRADQVDIVAFDPLGQRHAWTCSGLEAICLQHEIDHLDGRLIEDEELRPLTRSA